MKDFDQKIQQLISETQRINILRNNEIQLFKEINEISEKKLLLKEGNFKIGNNGPINELRSKIGQRLLQSLPIEPDWLENEKININSRDKKNRFQAWSNFAIFFPFIDPDLDFNVKWFLLEFGTETIDKLKIAEFANKPHAVDFLGSRNFGTDHIWLAIFNKFHKKHNTAIQMFISIEHTGLSCHVYDRLKNKLIHSLLIKSTENIKETIWEFFDQHKQYLIQDNILNAENRLLELGVKGQSIFKLSHGNEFFTKKEIQDCIDSNVAVMSDLTNSLGTSRKSQFEDFKNAKKGDLFYLCWGNNRFLLIGQFTDENVTNYQDSIEPTEWQQRKYRILVESSNTQNFVGKKKWWTPNNPSTFSQIPENEYDLANKLIFTKYFNVKITSDFSTPLPDIFQSPSARKEIIINENVEPKLDVQLIATEFAGIIDNLSGNKGQILGIFGSWGRGKTYLYNQVVEHLKTDETENKSSQLKFKYHHVSFNAWKYQDNERLWSHLFNEILKKYLNDNNSNKIWISWFQVQWKILNLNFKRNSHFPFLYVLLSLGFSIGLTFWLSRDIKFELINYLIGLVGFIGLIQLFFMYRKHYPSIVNLVKTYTKQKNYHEILGIQADIQKELNILMCQWIKQKYKDPNESKNTNNSEKKVKERLLLFVDDVDRCQEEKIIQIVDALRVMLDDDELVKRIIVVIAVDEDILERAIKYKYKDIFFEHKKEDGMGVKKVKDLITEYMDKLFIGGIKLPTLTFDEQKEMLKNYANSNGILEDTRTIEEDYTYPILVTNENEEDEDLTFPEINNNDLVYESIYFLTKNELSFLEDHVQKLGKNVTPRLIRIFFYRYLLAKNIAASYLFENTGNSKLSSEYCLFIGKCIASKTGEKENFEFKQEFDTDLIEDTKLKEFTPKLIEMIVPY